MYTVDKVIFYLNDNPVHTRTEAPLDADYTYTGLSEGTHSLKAEIYSGAILVDTKTVSTTIEAVVVPPPAEGGWATIHIADYVNRVNTDYGNVEDDAALENDLEVDIEQDYLDALAIYNPNGGYRTGKIYNVRDTGTAKPNLFDTDNFTTGWNRLGFVTVSNGELDYQNRSLAQKLTRANTALYCAEENVVVELNTDYTFSCEVKKGNLRYFHLANYLMGVDDKALIFDLDTGTIASGTDGFIDDIGNGWYRVGYKLNASSDNSGHYEVRASSTTSPSSSADGDYVFVSKVQLIKSSVFEEASRKPSFDLTVTGGGGTRINANGDVESVIKNRVTNSLDPTLLTSPTKTYNQIAPTGEDTAIKMTTNGSYFTYRLIGMSGLNGSNYSVFVKYVSGDPLIEIRWGNYGAFFNIQTGAIDSSHANLVNIAISDEGDGWYRISAATTLVSQDLRLYSSGVDDTAFILWGHQITDATDLKSFQLTTGTAAYPKIDHSTGRPAVRIEPARTNLYNKSYDHVGTGYNIDTALDEVGITGLPNTATTLTDASTTLSNKSYIEYSTGSHLYYRFSFWIKKVTSPTNFPALNVNNGAANELNIRILLHTETGDTIVLYDDGSMRHQVFDRGDWWELVIIRGDGTTNVVDYRVTIYPAYNNQFVNGYLNAAQGSIILGHLEVNPDCNILEATPIITNGAAVTRTYTDIVNKNFTMPTKGSLLIDCYLSGEVHHGKRLAEFAVNDNNRAQIFFDGTGNWDIYFNNNGNVVNVFSSTVATEGRHKVLVNWDNSTGLEVYVDGVLIGTDTGSNFVSPTNNWFALGCSYQSQYAAPSSIYDVQINEYKTSQEAIDLTTLWLAYYYTVRNYVNKVNNAYGVVESEEGLTTLFENENLLETEYDEINGWYTPIGGYRTGKIYDLSGNKADLTVTGGGGTRLNAAGEVENVIYNVVYPAYGSNDIHSNGTATETYNYAIAPNGTKTAARWVKVDSTNEYHKGTNYFLGSTENNVSIYLKRVVGTGDFYIHSSASYDAAYFDITNGTIISSDAALKAEISDEGNGWFRCSYEIKNPTNDSLYFYLSGAVGDEILLWGLQVTQHSLELKPYQEIIKNQAAYPKIDYSTGQAAFLIEPSRTNKASFSNNPYKGTNGCFNYGTLLPFVNNDAIAPDGTLTATKISQTNSTTNQGASQPSHIIAKDTPVAVSCYFKYIDYNYITLGEVSYYLKDYTATFDIETGTVVRTGAAITSAKITPAANGYYRLEITYLNPDYNNNSRTYNGWSFTDANGNMWLNGAGQSVHAWGYQSEEGLFCTSTIPTNGAAVTRTEKLAVIPLVLTDFDITIHLKVNAIVDSASLFSGGAKLYMQSSGAIRWNNGSNVTNNAFYSLTEGEECTLRIVKQNGLFTTYKNDVQQFQYSDITGTLTNPRITGDGNTFYPVLPMNIYSIKIKDLTTT